MIGGEAAHAAPSDISARIEALAAEQTESYDIGPDAPAYRAYLMAEQAHAGQRDKVGKDYLTAHVLKVRDRALILSPYELAERVAVVALLHDVVEDTAEKPEPVTLDMIEQEFGRETRLDVDALTQRVSGPVHKNSKVPRYETYMNLIARACARDVSLIVKLADNRVNFEGLGNITDRATRKRLHAKYSQAYKLLLSPEYTRRFGQNPPVEEWQFENEAGDRR